MAVSNYAQITLPVDMGTYKEVKKKTSSKKSAKEFIPESYSYDDIYNSLLQSGGGSSSSGGGVYKPNIDSLLNAYDQQRDATNAIAKAKYDADRATILNTIKRAQAQNEINVAAQNQAHVNDLSSLESAASQASRQNKIGDISRGLGGSGIQQLNQLRNLATQGNRANTISQKNTESLEKLRESLASTNTQAQSNLDKILGTYNDTITKAGDAAAANKAKAIWENESNYAEALARASASRASSGDSDYREAANDIYTNLRSMTSSLQNNIKAIKGMSTKELKAFAKSNGIDLKELGDSASKKQYRNYIIGSLERSSYDLVNELSQTYGMNPENFRRANSNIAGITKQFYPDPTSTSTSTKTTYPSGPSTLGNVTPNTMFFNTLLGLLGLDMI